MVLCTHSFQGEEGKIVILSTVRNGGGSDDEIESRNPTIGFLKVSAAAWEYDALAVSLIVSVSSPVDEPHQRRPFSSQGRPVYSGQRRGESDVSSTSA